MARPAKWNTQTTSIRVPEHAVDQLLELARLLDQGFVQNSAPRVQTFQTFLVGVDEKRFLVTGDCNDPRLDPIMQSLDAEMERLGLTKRDHQARFLAAMVEAMERRGVIQCLEPRA